MAHIRMASELVTVRVSHVVTAGGKETGDLGLENIMSLPVIFLGLCWYLTFLPPLLRYKLKYAEHCRFLLGDFPRGYHVAASKESDMQDRETGRYPQQTFVDLYKNARASRCLAMEQMSHVSSSEHKNVRIFKIQRQVSMIKSR